jgi:hypothetical protein
MEQLKWITVQRKVCDLIPNPENYKKLSETKKKKLIASLEKFGLVDIPVIDFDEMLLSGHQRLVCLIVMERENEVIDVRYPNRKLTKEELKEYTLIANQQYGDVDFDMLDIFLADVDLDLDNLGIDMTGFNSTMESITKEMVSEPKEKKVAETKELRPFKRVHVLLSFPPEKIIELQQLLEKIMAFDFVEYDQISN